MKIAIGTNYFKTYDRQTRAQECLRELKRRHSEISLYDVQFADEFSGHIDDFENLPLLTRSSKDVTTGKKKLPFVNDVFNVLSETDADYFVFTNSDILIREELVNVLLTQNITGRACSRVDIHPINSIQEPIKLYRWEIAGFDTFMFENKWYRANKHYFEDFLMGSVYFDHHYAGVIKAVTKDKIENKNPPLILHEMHQCNWSIEDEEAKFNDNQRKKSPYRYLSQQWDEYFDKYLRFKRRNGFVFDTENDVEQIEEQKYFTL